MQPYKTFPARKISKKNKAPALVSCTDVTYIVQQIKQVIVQNASDTPNLA